MAGDGDARTVEFALTSGRKPRILLAAKVAVGFLIFVLVLIVGIASEQTPRSSARSAPAVATTPLGCSMRPEMSNGVQIQEMVDQWCVEKGLAKELCGLTVTTNPNVNLTNPFETRVWYLAERNIVQVMQNPRLARYHFTCLNLRLHIQKDVYLSDMQWTSLLMPGPMTADLRYSIYDS